MKGKEDVTNSEVAKLKIELYSFGSACKDPGGII